MELVCPAGNLPALKAAVDYELGANSFVSKPVNIDEFTRAVKDLGLYWLIINTASKNRHQ